MSDRLMSDQETYIAHLFYIAQELKKKSSAISSSNYGILFLQRHTTYNIKYFMVSKSIKFGEVVPVH